MKKLKIKQGGKIRGKKDEEKIENKKGIFVKIITEKKNIEKKNRKNNIYKNNYIL